MRSLNATEKEVMAVQVPEFTDSWHPIGHGDVINAIRNAVAENDLEIIDSNYSLTKSGSNMFGTLGFSGKGIGDKKTVMHVGFRNSLDKQMAIGVTAGTKVVVCSNMCFSGDFIKFRKHTGRLDLDELREIAIEAIKIAIERITGLFDWQESLKSMPLSMNHMKVLTFDAMKEGAINPKRFSQTLDMYQEEVGLNGETVYAFHGMGTRACRDESLFKINERTAILESLVKRFIAS